MKLEYELKATQSQKLVMTPELIQAIQILQYSTQELEAFVEEELLSNPMLEKTTADGEDSPPISDGGDEYVSASGENGEITQERDFSGEDMMQAFIEGRYDDISYRQREYFESGSEFTFEQYVIPQETLKEHLLEQLALVNLGATSHNIASYIIESLDDNGYMTLNIEELMRYFGKDEKRIKNIIHLIQSFEPAGVAAKDLRQCLKIQLKRRGLLDKITAYIVNNYLQDIAENRLGFIAKEMGISVSEVQKVSDLIRTLEPKPGREFASETAVKYIVPDIIIEKEGEKFVVRTNEAGIPHLMLSTYYENVRRQAQNDEEVSKFLNERFNSAVRLIKSIEQRKQTISKVAEAVVERQKEFFEKGIKYLKPLTLRQIADDIGMHESTVSRSVNGKYLQSSRGLFEIKYFFSSGVAVQSGEGAVASEGVKSIIRDIIAKENPHMPYSDQCLCEILREQSIDISRRTVAKYRDEMNILSSSKRKRY